MLMLSSSSTSPRSSRPTMLSSSFKARSNDISLMSTCLAAGLVLTMLSSLVADRARETASGPRVHQGLDVHADGLGQGGQVVAPFQHGHQPPLGVPGGGLGNLVGGPGEIRLQQPQVGEGIVGMGVEAGRDEHDVGAEVAQSRQDALLERLLEAIAPVAGTQGGIPDVAD